MSDDTPVSVRFEPDGAIEGDWQVRSYVIRQRLCEPGETTIELHSQDLMAEPSLMLGTSATIIIERGGIVHEFSGILERVQDGVSSQHELICTVLMVPALVALRHKTNSRIFQEMTIPEILEQVLSEGLGAYEREVDLGLLSGDYPAQEYTVQYEETDFDFVHRLMEEHGISYYFVSEGGAEVMTLFDTDAAWVDLVSLGNSDGMLPMVTRGDSPGMTEEIREFRRNSKLRSTAARTRVFNWLTPEDPYETEVVSALELATPNGAGLDPEREDYRHDEPSSLSGYRSAGLETAAVDQDLAIRRAVHQRDAIRCVGVSTATGMTAGVRFELLDHPQPGVNDQYVIVAVEHVSGLGADGDGEDGYANHFECLPSDVEWRPERRRKRPRISSIQTATVVGPAGEEIHTDEHGRIKVQFHWDRLGASDENSSCFVRVVQPWSGNGWGFVFLPRIGMEVAVTFIDGDPDRPVVMGCLYNGTNVPPYGLPDDKTKSTVKTNSSPGGGGFNELRFEDAAGSEEIFIHAQKDFNEVVLNNHNTTVGNNQTNNVDVDQTQTVHGNQFETIDGNQEMTVHTNRTVVVDANFDETVGGTETRKVTGDVSETFLANETREITGDQTETITGSVTHTITGDQTDTITGSLSQTVIGGISQTTPATFDVTAAAGVTITSGAAMKLVAPAGLTIVAPGGTTTVDSFFESIGGKDDDFFAWKTSVLSGKVTMVYALALSLLNNKVDLVALKVDIARTVFKRAGDPELKSVGACIQQGYVNLKLFGIIALN